jgi:hypothetical protein
MFFKADSRVSRSGFKIMVEQIRNSCNRRTSASPPFGTTVNPSWSFGASRPVGGTRDDGQPRICNYSSASFLIISSENYPNYYRSNTDCIYRINRRDSRVCGLEIFFQDFSVGTWESDVISNQQLCINDYVKIGSQYFCGYRKNERVIQQFTPSFDYIDIRFFTDASVNYPGFVMEVRQVDTCRGGIPVSPVASFRGGRKVPLDPHITPRTKDVVQTTVSIRPSTPVPAGGPFCGAKSFKEESFDILSPGYNDRGRYEAWTDCHYTVKKVHFTVCALEVRFNIMALEDEDPDKQCSRDFLQFGPDVRVCGKMAQSTTRKLMMNL